mgnify:CR=1 FL=1
MKIAVLPGDGIGPEIMAQALRVLDFFKAEGMPIEIETGLIGGCAVDATGVPLPDSTLKLALEADAVLLGAVGGPQYDTLPREQRPERGREGRGPDDRELGRQPVVLGQRRADGHPQTADRLRPGLAESRRGQSHD